MRVRCGGWETGLARGTREDALSALRRCRLFAAADDETVERLASAAEVTDAPRGTLLATEGDAADRFGVVVAGRVRVFHASADGRSLTFETVGATEPFAAVAALAGGRHPASVEAATPVTVAWLDRRTLFAQLDGQPDLARTLIADLAGRVVHLTSVATSLALDVPARLAAFLFQRALAAGRPTESGVLVDLGMTKAELASSLGTVPETLSRALARLRDDGVIVVRAKDVIVKDVGALARLGSGYSED